MKNAAGEDHMLSQKLCAPLAFLVTAFLPLLTEAKEVNIVLPEARPWAFHVENSNEIEGAGVAITRELIKRAGVSGNIQILPFARLSTALKSGDADIAFMLWNDDHTAFARKGPILISQDFGIIPRSDIAITNYDDLAKLNIATVRGIPIDSRFDADSALKKDEAVNYDVAIKKVLAGRNDAIAGSLMALRVSLNQMSLLDKFGTPLVLRKIDILVHYSNRAETESIQQTLDPLVGAMHSDGTINQIIQKYFR